MRSLPRKLLTAGLLAIYGGIAVLGYGLHELSPPGHHHGPAASSVCHVHLRRPLAQSWPRLSRQLAQTARTSAKSASFSTRCAANGRNVDGRSRLAAFRRGRDRCSAAHYLSDHAWSPRTARPADSRRLVSVACGARPARSPSFDRASSCGGDLRRLRAHIRFARHRHGSQIGLYAGRAAGRDCHHRRLDRAVVAGGAGRPGRGPAHPVREQHAADRPGNPPVLRRAPGAVSADGARRRQRRPQDVLDHHVRAVHGERRRGAAVSRGSDEIRLGAKTDVVGRPATR